LLIIVTGFEEQRVVSEMDLLEELKKITQNLDKAGIDYALCGGLAIAIYARPRATLDIDIMVQPD